MMKPPLGTQLRKGHPLARGLIGCWLFNDGPPLLGTTYDLSGNDNHGTLAADAHIEGGKFGPDMSFDGTGDYIDLGVTELQGTSLFADSTQKFTISFWSKVLPSNQGSFIAKAGATPSNRQFQIFLSGFDSLDFRIRGTVTSTTANFDDGVLHFVTMTWNGTDANVYVDGGDAVALNVGLASEETGENIIFGARTGGSSFFLNGTIDNVMIWNRALTPREAASLYTDPFQMFKKEPWALWIGAVSGGGVPAGTNMQINIGDAWKSVAGMQINIGDAWKSVAGMQINIGDAWKTVF